MVGARSGASWVCCGPGALMVTPMTARERPFSPEDVEYRFPVFGTVGSLVADAFRVGVTIPEFLFVETRRLLLLLLTAGTRLLG